jgi:cyclic beta-1,2-glucan synthetase
LITFIRAAVGRAPSASAWDNREAIREEIFSVERLEEHARSLAVAQVVTPKPAKGHPLLGRLVANGVVLLDAHHAIAKAIDAGHAITPAAEWLVDNYHLVERQIREIRSDLPPGYYRQLPSSPAGRSPGIRACSAWPGPSSLTPTAASIPRCSAAMSGPIRRFSR